MGYFVIPKINCNRISAGAYCWKDLQVQEEQEMLLADRGRVSVGRINIFSASSSLSQSLLCSGLVSSIGVLLPYPMPDSSLSCLGLRWSAPSLFTTLAYWSVCFYCRKDILLSSREIVVGYQ